MAENGQSLLADGSDPDLRVAVYGDLASAGHIAVLVPGVESWPEDFDADLVGGTGDSWWRGLPGSARSLLAASGQVEGAANDLAVVAWLGYKTPAALTGAKPDGMEQGAANLVAFARFLALERPNADTTWVCHSYGSLVCAAALVDSDPDALVLIGSPGVAVDDVTGLATSAPVWAGQTEADLIGLTRLLGLYGGSFGPLPASQPFGARTFDCTPDDGHSDYFRPGSLQLEAMAKIVLGYQAD
jgi:hypothetical protein